MAMGKYNWKPNSDANMFDCQDSDADLSDDQDSEADEQNGFADIAEDDFTHNDIGDLVWAKVKSHPWWPGQVYDPALASEEAKSMEKSGRLLVAFYGDHTFSWLEHSHILPFRSNFQVKVSATSAKMFKQAVWEALDEVFWRAQFGLQCGCRKSFLGYECTASSKVWSHGAPVRFRSCKDVTMSKKVLNTQECLSFLKDVACSPCRFFGFGYASTVLHGNALGIRTGLFANISEDIVLGSESDCSTLRASVCMSESSLDVSDRNVINGTTINGRNWSVCRKRVIEESAFSLEEWRAKRSHVVDRDDEASDHLMQISQALHFLAIDPLCGYGSESSLARAVDAVLIYRSLVFQKSSGYGTHVRSSFPEDGKRIDAHCVSEHDRSTEAKAIQYCRPTNQRCNRYAVVHANDPKFAEKPQNQTKQMATPDSHVQWTTGAAYEGKKVYDKECGRMDALLGLSPMKGVSRAHFNTEGNLVSPKLDVHELLLEAQRVKTSHRSSENGTMSHPPVGLFMKFPSRFTLPSEFQLNAIFKEFGALGSSGARVFRETASAQVIFKHANEAETAYKRVKQVNPFGNASDAFRLQHFALQHFARS